MRYILINHIINTFIIMIIFKTNCSEVTELAETYIPSSLARAGSQDLSFILRLKFGVDGSIGKRSDNSVPHTNDEILW